MVASAMNSSMSTTWVQEASLLSRRPSMAEIDSPEAQMPRKPASSTILAERPLCASMMKLSAGSSSIVRSIAGREVARMGVAALAGLKSFGNSTSPRVSGSAASALFNRRHRHIIVLS